jgi:hypothetical protein
VSFVTAVKVLDFRLEGPCEMHVKFFGFLWCFIQDKKSSLVPNFALGHRRVGQVESSESSTY